MRLDTPKTLTHYLDTTLEVMDVFESSGKVNLDSVANQRNQSRREGRPHSLDNKTLQAILLPVIPAVDSIQDGASADSSVHNSSLGERGMVTQGVIIPPGREDHFEAPSNVANTWFRDQTGLRRQLLTDALVEPSGQVLQVLEGFISCSNSCPYSASKN